MRPDQQEAMRSVADLLTDIDGIAIGAPVDKAVSKSEALGFITGPADAGPKGDIAGFFTRAEDMVGASTSEEVIDRLRLDYHSSPFIGGESFAVIETPWTATLRDNTSIPRTPDYAPAGPNEYITNGGYPFTGHGLKASRDGRLVRELAAAPTPMEVDVTVISFKNGAGEPEVLTIGGLSSDKWILRQDATDPEAVFWEPWDG